MNGEAADKFSRQRRSFIALSLVLYVANIPNEIPFGSGDHSTSLTVHAPFTVSGILWTVWAYFLYRYIALLSKTEFRHTLVEYRTRMREIIFDIAFKQIKSLPDFEKNVGQGVNPRAVRREGGQQIDLETYKRWSVELLLVQAFQNGHQKTTVGNPLEWRPRVVVEGWRVIFSHVRAWAYVIFRTPYICEYWLPFVFLALPFIKICQG